MFATYVHDLNPVLLRLTDAIQLRWYGLAYMMGFIAGFFLLRNLARRGLWVLKPEQTGDFIAAAALFGVFIGGRLGWVLGYFQDGMINSSWFENLISHPFDPFGVPFFNPLWMSGILADPLLPFRVWQGGMASHGGIMGLMIFTWFYARKYQVTWTGLGDGLCVVAPLGLFFGRTANFINGELYGRVAEGVAWAVKFPLSLEKTTQEVQNAAWQACTQVEPRLAEAESLDQLIATARANPEVAGTLGNFLPPRHPSQIYEALLEGALLFGILWWVRTRFPKAPDGLLTGMFFALYAVFRIIGEQFREPDAELVGMLTKGQFFSLFMFLFAAAFLFHAWRGWKRCMLRV